MCKSIDMSDFENSVLKVGWYDVRIFFYLKLFNELQVIALNFRKLRLR